MVKEKDKLELLSQLECWISFLDFDNEKINIVKTIQYYDDFNKHKNITVKYYLLKYFTLKYYL